MTEQAFEPMRRAMVASQLRTTGVNDPRVIAAMGEVARERFVPEAQRPLAYADAAVPLGGGRALNPPMALGRMLTEAALTGSEHALVIGAGPGYAAAVLARLAHSVVALEEDVALLARAKKAGVAVVKGPLAKGWPKAAPYDFILIDGAVEQVPDAILGQLADGGRISFALVDRGITRLAIGRMAAGAFGMRTYTDAAAAVLPGFERPRGFSF